jgi:putative membrane protein
MSYLITFLVLMTSIWVTAKVLPGADIDDFISALPAAIILTILTFFIEPILIILSIPLTIITFGLFLWVIDGIIIWMVSKITSGLKIQSFGWAIVFSLVLSVVQSAISFLLDHTIAS